MNIFCCGGKREGAYFHPLGMKVGKKGTFPREKFWAHSALTQETLRPLQVTVMVASMERAIEQNSGLNTPAIGDFEVCCEC